MSMLRAMSPSSCKAAMRRVSNLPVSSAFLSQQYSRLGAPVLTGLDRSVRCASFQSAPAGGATKATTQVEVDGNATRGIGTKPEIGAQVNEEEMRPGERSQVHFRATTNKHPLGLGPPKKPGKEWSMPHEIWSPDEVNNIQVTHKEPEEAVDHLALRGVRFLRLSFDVLAGFKTGVIDEHKYLNRVIFLETVAGIPGMVAGTLRHLTSLRRMRSTQQPLCSD